jgi:elongation factor 1-alpha
MAEGKKHVSIVICGHVDAGKSTTTGRLIYELGGIPEREMEKLRAEAEALGKSSFAFAFYMDRQKEERERGVTIACTTKEFFTENFHYTIIDAPGHRDFIKNMITGASQADCALLMVPANQGGFETSIAKGNHKMGQVQGQTRQHARLINLLGVEQLMIGVNKMDDKSVNYAESRFTEIKKEVADMLVRVGYKKDKVASSVPFLPISGWEGDNLLKKSDKMAWWKGCDIKKIDGSDLHIDCLLYCLNNMVLVPPRPSDKDLRMPVSGVHKIKGVGDVITGRLEQGIVKPGDECVFIPTNTASTPCGGKIFSVEMHHKSVPEAGPGDNVGLNVKGLAKENMPRVGDVMVLKKDSKISRCKNFSAAVVVLEHPGQLKPGYTPVAFVRTGRSAVKMTSIKFKMGKSTGGQKVESPQFLETGDMAECAFEPVQAFVVEPFKTCAGLGRVAIMEGNSVVMLGKVMSAEYNL